MEKYENSLSAVTSRTGRLSRLPEQGLYVAGVFTELLFSYI